MTRLYLPLAVLGLVIPYGFLGIFVYSSGEQDLLNLAYAGLSNPIAAFFVTDVILTAIVFLVFLLRECRRLGMKSWGFYLAATLVSGPSFAFPLFMHFRERRRAYLRAKRSRSEG